MAYKRKFPVEFDVSSEERSFDSSEDEHSSPYSDEGGLNFDEISEEDLRLESNTEENESFCDHCFVYKLIRVTASYMCYVCGFYYCDDCFIGHDEYHGHIYVANESEGLEGEIDEFVSYMMNESEKERKERIRMTNVCVCDRVNTKHEIDGVNCKISGLTGYKYKWWVVCDKSNSCIKVFSLRSNVLQRYIRLGSQPHDVTEIIVKHKTTEQDSASCSETAIDGTYNKSDRKHLLAATFPHKSLVLIIDLGKNPAVIHTKIKTENECYGIDFYDGSIYIACGESGVSSSWNVHIMSVEGVTLKTFKTYDWPFGTFVVDPYFPYLTVLNGNIYVTDPNNCQVNNCRVLCFNTEGRVLHEITIEAWAGGICVDRSENKIYVCSLWRSLTVATGFGIVYELDSDLSRHLWFIEVRGPVYRVKDFPAICFYSDKLYVGHVCPVTVARLL